MSTPGGNLFKQAMRLIKPTKIQYFKATGRTQNDARQWIPSFAEAEPLMASVQAVPRTKYIEYGLEFKKDYIKVFAAANLIGVDRDTSGDRLSWNGQLYQIVDEKDWFVQDGWAWCLAVKLKRSVIK